MAQPLVPSGIPRCIGIDAGVWRRGRGQRRYGAFCAGTGLLLAVGPLLARSGFIAWRDFSPVTLGVMLGLLLLQSGLLGLWALAPEEARTA